MRIIHSFMFRRISLTIVPVLVLGTDLSNKVGEKLSHACGCIVLTHLDEIETKSDTKEIIYNNLALIITTKKTGVLFTSSRSLIDISL